MTALTTRTFAFAGTVPTFVAASTSDTVEVGNGINTVVVYRNTSGTPKTVTIMVQGTTPYGEPRPDPAITLPATTGEIWIPMRTVFDIGDGTSRATITMTPDATGVTVACVRVG